MLSINRMARKAGKKSSVRPSLFSVSSSFLARFRTNNSKDWEYANTESVLKRFRLAQEGVPAYRNFLDRMGVKPHSMRRTKDTSKIPPISKNNYLRAHPWDKLCVSDALAGEALVLTATSGSTGEPFYIPRTDEAHEASMFFHRLFMERSGLDQKKPTLVVVCFGMGVWIGGLLTYEAFRRISLQKMPLTIITPGVSKKEIFETLTRVAPSYEQLVLCGYPPFIKDVLDDGPRHGVDWKRWDMRIVCAAEAFSEQFREHLMRKAGMKDPYRSIMNIYGSAELGTMGTETPLTILLRRLALKHETLYRKLFSEAYRLPTLVQFIPEIVAFEASKDGAIYATGGTSLPFVRYDIGDNGGVFSFAYAETACKELGIDLKAEARHAGIEDTIMELPFVYLYERADLSTKLYGAIIYPEHVKIGVQGKEFESSITGRFTMTTETDKDHNEYLEINFELAPGVSDGESIREMLTESVVRSLMASSDEYRYLSGSISEKVRPRLIFWPHEDPKYFQPGIKQRWVVSKKS